MIQIETMSDFILVVVLPSVVIAIVLAGVCLLLTSFGQRWEQKNPACSRCGRRRKKWGVEPISLVGGLTSYYICQEHKSQADIEAGEYQWACVLVDLHETAKIIPGYEVTTLSFWPKGVEGTRPLGIKEIMMIVAGR